MSSSIVRTKARAARLQDGRCVCGVLIEWRPVDVPARGDEPPMTKRMPFDMEARGLRHQCRRSGPVKVRQATAEERAAFGIREPRQH